jgi:NitT/TauT family transport system permease protein
VTALGSRARDAALGAAPLIMLVLLWHWAATSGVVNRALLPPPGAVAARFVQLLGDPFFLGQAATTLARLFAGFAIALAVGVALALLMVASPFAAAALRPLVRVLAPIPKIALYPAFVLTLGFEDAPKIALVVADVVFPILLATYAGASAVEPKLLWAARAAGASPARVLFGVVLPAAAPSILTGCRIGLVIGCIVVFLAEMIQSTDGLGHLLVRAARNFQTVDMFVPLLAISILGLTLNALLGLARKRLLRGFPGEDRR